MKMTKRFKSKRGGSSNSTTCKGRLKGKKGNPKCEDSSGCKWIPKKGKVKGHCATRTQSSNSKKSVKAKKNSVNGKPAMPEGPYYDPSHYKPEPQEGDKLRWDQKTDVSEHFRKGLSRLTVPNGENKKIYINHLHQGVDKFIDNYEYDPEWSHHFWNPSEDDELLTSQVTAMIDSEMKDGSFAPGGYLSV